MGKPFIGRGETISIISNGLNLIVAIARCASILSDISKKLMLGTIGFTNYI